MTGRRSIRFRPMAAPDGSTWLGSASGPAAAVQQPHAERGDHEPGGEGDQRLLEEGGSGAGEQSRRDEGTRGGRRRCGPAVRSGRAVRSTAASARSPRPGRRPRRYAGRCSRPPEDRGERGARLGRGTHLDAYTAVVEEQGVTGERTAGVL